MKAHKSRQKKQQCIKHREAEYLKALGKVIDGKADPNYATERFKKLKEVKK